MISHVHQHSVLSYLTTQLQWVLCAPPLHRGYYFNANWTIASLCSRHHLRTWLHVHGESKQQSIYCSEYHPSYYPSITVRDNYIIPPMYQSIMSHSSITLGMISCYNPAKCDTTMILVHRWNDIVVPHSYAWVIARMIFTAIYRLCQ